MATSNKTKKAAASNPPNKPTTATTSQKQSIKDRRAAQQKRQQEQQRVILAIVAAALLIGVILVVFVSTRPVEAAIPPETVARYKPFADAKLTGTTPEGFPFLGAENAPVVMEEVSNFACPHCAEYHDGTFVNLLDKIQAGQLKFVYVPLATPLAFDPTAATKGAICAGQQGKFWEMQETLFSWQTKYGTDAGNPRRVETGASNLGLDMGKFGDCLNSTPTNTTLQNAVDLANKRNVPGTPTVYMDGQAITGDNALTLSQIRGYIETKATVKK